MKMEIILNWESTTQLLSYIVAEVLMISPSQLLYVFWLQLLCWRLDITAKANSYLYLSAYGFYYDYGNDVFSYQQTQSLWHICTVLIIFRLLSGTSPTSKSVGYDFGLERLVFKLMRHIQLTVNPLMSREWPIIRSTQSEPSQVQDIEYCVMQTDYFRLAFCLWVLSMIYLNKMSIKIVVVVVAVDAQINFSRRLNLIFFYAA